MSTLRLLLRNLSRKKLRTSLLVVSVALAFLVFGVLGAFQAAVDRRAGTDSNRYISMNRVSFTLPLPYSSFVTISGLPGVQAATHVNWFGGYAGEPRNQITTLAVDPSSYLPLYADTLAVDPAAAAAFIAGRMTALVGADLAARQGWHPGDRIALSSNIFRHPDGSNRWELDVVGLIHPAKPGVDSNVVLMHYDYFNETRSFGKDRINYVISRPLPGTSGAGYAGMIDAQFEGSADVVSTSTEQAFSRAFLAQFGNIALIIVLVVGAAFVVTLFILGTTMMIAIRERTREFGIMMTLGFSRAWVARSVLAESLAIALLGGGVGLALAWAGTGVLRPALTRIGLGLALTPQVLLAALALMLLLGFVTGLLPSWQAARLRIVRALEGR